MPPFPKPAFEYDYELDAEIAALGEYKQTKPGRAIPPKQSDRVLLATWNIANLGVQERRDKDYRLLTEILDWFDLIAVQEVDDSLAGLRAIHQHLGADYRLLFSDASGNDERMVFVYDATKLALLEEVGQVAPPPSDCRHISLPGIQQRFDGFDRNPYLATFRTGAFTCSLVNVHLYFGSDSAIARNRRGLEAFAVARWADNRRKSPHVTTRDIIPLGDFNLPRTVPGDAIFDALTKRGCSCRRTPPRSPPASPATTTMTSTTSWPSSPATPSRTPSARSACSTSTGRCSRTVADQDAAGVPGLRALLPVRPPAPVGPVQDPPVKPSSPTGIRFAGERGS